MNPRFISLNVYHPQCTEGKIPVLILPSHRRGGLMFSALHSGSKGLGSNPGRGHRVVFLGKTLNPSLHLLIILSARKS